MSMKQSTYEKERKNIRAGDVFAFSGDCLVSGGIEFITGGDVSHVGIVMEHTQEDGVHRNLLIESTSLNGGGGVSTSMLSEVIENYDGKVWWLPLRHKMNGLQKLRFFDYLTRKIGTPYDTKQALGAGLHIFKNKEDDTKLFCSELVAFSLEHIHIIGGVNSSETNPADLCSWDIFWPTYTQLKGDKKEIDDFNSVEAGG